MKLENQVTSLETSKKLKELGVKQESFFRWEVAGSGQRVRLIWESQCNEAHFDTADLREFYSALTVAELGEMLNVIEAMEYRVVGNAPSQDFEGEMFKEGEIMGRQLWVGLRFRGIVDDNEAEARAKMLIYLKENKLI